MASEKEHEVAPVSFHFQGRSYTGAFATISLLLAFLFVANLYTLDKLNSAREEAVNLRAALSKEIEGVKAQNQGLLLKYSILTAVQTNQIGELRSELDAAARQLGVSTGHVLNRARTMVAALQKEQAQQNDALEEKVSQKAGADDLASLGENVTTVQSELGTTDKTVAVLAKDLSVTRSELGGLIAKTHDQVQALQQLTDREYRGFALTKNRMSHLGGIRLILKKTDVREQSFNLNVIVNDQEIRNKGRNAFEPLYFYVGQLRTPYELVVTAVGPDNVRGYIGIPKADVQQEAEEGLRPRT